MLDGMMVGMIDDTISGMLSFVKRVVTRNTSVHTISCEENILRKAPPTSPTPLGS